MNMYRNAIVADDFKVPEVLRTDTFILKPLTINEVDIDYRAVQESVDVDGKPTPRPDLTRDQNLIDLGWHQKEFQKRSSFAYTVSSPDEKDCWGCVYIYPTERAGVDAELSYWVTKQAYENAVLVALTKALRQWLSERWPFMRVFDEVINEVISTKR